MNRETHILPWREAARRFRDHRSSQYGDTAVPAIPLYRKAPKAQRQKAIAR